MLPCTFVIQDSEEWVEKIGACHQRAADRILQGCLKNAGIYIKLGQGLASFNHILPKQYLTTLEILQDKALHRKSKEVKSYNLLQSLTCI
jgi:aarF domain-containing kinase